MRIMSPALLLIVTFACSQQQSGIYSPDSPAYPNPPGTSSREAYLACKGLELVEWSLQPWEYPRRHNQQAIADQWKVAEDIKKMYPSRGSMIGFCNKARARYRFERAQDEGA